MSAPHNNHRHCYLLRGQAKAVFPSFIRLCSNLSSLLICAQDTQEYTSLNHQEQDKSLHFLAFKQVKNELGQSHDGLLLDLTHGVSANVLAIVSGTLRGGGVLAIVLPEGNWLHYHDQDLARHLPWPLEPQQVQSTFKHYFFDKLIAASSPFKALPLNKVDPVDCITTPQKSTLTEQQTELKNQIQHSLLKAGSSNHVLIAPRGRGKSTLLGDMLATWIKNQKRVVVTAPNSSAVTTLNARYEDQMQGEETSPPLPFMAPDALLLTLKEHPDKKWDYLIVDEAAMIPVPMLIHLLKAAHHCFFSTTDYGYEGAGKGFGLRFCKHLNNLDTPLIRYTLTTPIRWGENDPLETWVNQLFFLTPEQDTRSKPERGSPTLSVKQVQGKEWLNELTLLEAAFHLLVNAHYQTSPDNLRWVMDNPAVSTWVLYDTNTPPQNTLKSVAIITKEGSLPGELSQAVLEGRRRPRGHLIPQSLLAHEGQMDAGQYSYWRISRIATQTIEQSQGHGSKLIQNIEASATQQSIDFLSTSFAVTEDTLNFWRKNGFIPVRLATTKDQASGSYSLMMVKPLTTEAKQRSQTWHQDYLDNLAINLFRDYDDIPPSLHHALGIHQPVTNTPLTTKDKNDLTLFVEHHRPYLTIRAQLTRLVNHIIDHNKMVHHNHHGPLLKAITTQAVDQIDFKTFGLTTKKQIDSHIKKIVSELLKRVE